jgi:hypothetical protein
MSSAATIFKTRPLLALPLALGANYERIGWQRLVDKDQTRFGALSQWLYALEGLKPLQLMHYVDDWKTLFQLLAYSEALSQLKPLLTTLEGETADGLLAWRVSSCFATRPVRDVAAHEANLDAHQNIIILPVRYEEEYYMAAYASAASLSQMLVLLTTQLIAMNTTDRLYDGMMKACIDVASLVATTLHRLSELSQSRAHLRGLSESAIGVKVVQPPPTATSSPSVPLTLVEDILPFQGQALAIWAAVARAQLAELWVMIYMNKEADAASSEGSEMLEQQLAFVHKCATMAARCASEYQMAFELITVFLASGGSSSSGGDGKSKSQQRQAKLEALSAGPQMQGQLYGTVAVKRYAYAAMASIYADTWKISSGAHDDTEVRTFLVRSASRTLEALQSALREAEKNDLTAERVNDFKAMHGEYDQMVQGRWDALAAAASLLPTDGAASGLTLESILGLQTPMLLIGFDNIINDAPRSPEEGAEQEEEESVHATDGLDAMEHRVLSPLMERWRSKTLPLFKSVLPASIVRTVIDEIYERHRQTLVSALLRSEMVSSPPVASVGHPKAALPIASSRSEDAAKPHVPDSIKELFAKQAMAFHALRRVGLLGRDIHQLTRPPTLVVPELSGGGGASTDRPQPSPSIISLPAWRRQFNERLLLQFTRLVNIVLLVFSSPPRPTGAATISLIDLPSSPASPLMTLDELLKLSRLVAGQKWEELIGHGSRTLIACLQLDSLLVTQDLQLLKQITQLLQEEVEGARKLL